MCIFVIFFQLVVINLYNLLFFINSLTKRNKTTNNIVKDFNNAVSITPGICFSYDLYRIGYGKGYYDKFYSNHGVYKIGLCYSNCLIDKIDNDRYDIKVNEIITDNQKKVL